MAKDGPGGEKTEKPTPQRLKKARKEGQIPRTQELGTWLGVATASVLLPMMVGDAFESVQKLFVQIGSVANNPEPAALSVLMGQALTAFMTTLLPMALGMMVVGTVAAAAQGGVTFATKSMKPTLKKLNPFPGIKRMFGTQGLWESAKALIKTAALATVVIVTSDRAQELVSSAGALPLSAVAATFTDSAILMFRVVAVTGLIIAVADYVIVRMKTMKKLKMSKYEITQEHKQAKGAGEVAAKLREKAMEAGVPLVQDIPLARALHASCDIGQEVPAQLFTAVARVLAFVMHLSARGVRGGFHRPGFEAPDVGDLPRAGRRR